MEEKEHETETGEQIARRWVPAVVEGLARYTDEEQQKRILELCGRSCAEHDLWKIEKLKSEAQDRRQLVELMNQHIAWCGEWTWEGERITTVCGYCGCPLAREFQLARSPGFPTFCLCSRGWVKAMFSEAFGEEVEVELRQAIGRGDDCCEFFVHVNGAGE